MRDAVIAGYFKQHKQRMGTTLDQLDEALTTSIKVVKNRQFDAWQRQQLGAKWDTWMDRRFAAADARLTDRMNRWVRELEQRWATPDKVTAAEDKNGDGDADKDRKTELREYIKIIQALRAQWESEKEITWTKPW